MPAIWNPESSELGGIRNPVFGIRNPQRGIQNPRLSPTDYLIWGD